MAPDVNWGIVGSIARGGAQDDEAIEQVIEILQSVNEEELRDDSEKLILLLLSARKALDVRFIFGIYVFFNFGCLSIIIYIYKFSMSICMYERLSTSL